MKMPKIVVYAAKVYFALIIVIMTMFIAVALYQLARENWALARVMIGLITLLLSMMAAGWVIASDDTG